MKKIAIILIISCAVISNAQTTLTFTGRDHTGDYLQLYDVVVQNLTRDWTDTLFFPDTILILSGVGIEGHEVSEFALSQNIPNPFAGVTDFTLMMPDAERVVIEVHDLAGRKITGTTQRLEAGMHTFRVWIAEPQTCILTAHAGKSTASVKMVNSGHGSQNSITYSGDGIKPFPFKARFISTHPFENGDLMRYVGHTISGNSLIVSDTIEQSQNGNENITLVFYLEEPFQNNGHFLDTTKSFIPDGVECNGNCMSTMNFNVTGYPNGSSITSGQDILYVRLKMEHSALGDLWISLKCPNGQYASIMKYGGAGSSDCSSLIPQSERGWLATGNFLSYLGLANDNQDNIADKCDSITNPMGTCWNYCWSNNVSQGYQYACNHGYVYEPCSHHYANNPNGSHTSADSTNMTNMTKVYHPDVSFNSLIGCPINGLWQIQVVDGNSLDNGYIEEAELALSVLPTEQPTLLTIPQWNHIYQLGIRPLHRILDGNLAPLNSPSHHLRLYHVD